MSAKTKPRKTKLKRWPLMPGQFETGDPYSPVAIVTLSSEIELAPANRSLYSALGKLTTENLGIERLLANVLANPNIRFILVCGKDVQGHWPGQTLFSLHSKGIDSKQRVIGSKGAFPFIQNISKKAISRFSKQVELVDLIGETSAEKIQSTASRLALRDPGSFGKPMIEVEYVKEKEEKQKKAAKAKLPAHLSHIAGNVYLDLRKNLVISKG
ncbi:Tetrahydromethanopterin S-methyltransferase subunit A 1 [Candidatus Gugararchaeum adminiculabundum]|nr:Tetrahydromethanopterin S-methyltransferase subunit A 1 [Candidatus Gugararchaeum adminiculabundum]